MKAKATASGVPVYCAHDKVVPVETLIPNPANPNTHPDEQIKLLGRIISEQGWRACITVSNLSGLVVRGHGRLLAAQHMGLKEVPVDYQNYTSEAEEYADLIADNRIAELAEIDMEKLAEMLEEIEEDIDPALAGFTDEELAALMTATDRGGHIVEEDDYEEPDNLPPVSQPGDIWQLGEHRLICGDSSSIKTIDGLMEGEKADLLFTDPPYGVAIGDKNKMLNSIKKGGRIVSNIAGDTLKPTALREMLISVFTNVRERALSDSCAVYVTAPQGGDLGLVMLEMMKESGLPVRHNLVWVKNVATFSVGRLDYDYQHEPIMFTWTKTHKRIKAGAHKTSCWFIDRPRESKLHPTMKPIALVANAILNSSEAGDIVVDPFGGSGSTLIAAQQTGRRCRMVELDPHYCDVILDRYVQQVGTDKEIVLHRQGKKTSYARIKKN